MHNLVVLHIVWLSTVNNWIFGWIYVYSGCTQIFTNCIMLQDIAYCPINTNLMMNNYFVHWQTINSVRIIWHWLTVLFILSLKIRYKLFIHYIYRCNRKSISIFIRMNEFWYTHMIYCKLCYLGAYTFLLVYQYAQLHNTIYNVYRVLLVTLT